MNYKAVVLDVDGTIIPPGVPGAAGLTPLLMETVGKTQKMGVSVTLATARSIDWVQEIVDRLQLTAPLILDNGARLWDPVRQSYLSESYLPQATAQKVLTFLRQFPYPIHFVDNDVRHTFSADQSVPMTKTVKIMVLHMKPEDTEHLYQQLQTISDIQITKSISGDNPVVESIHVTSHDATKDGGLRKFAQHLGISLAEIIGIGDSYNDMSFLSICGFKIAMGNAIAEVKSLADYTTDSCQDDGVARALQKFILSAQQ